MLDSFDTLSSVDSQAPTKKRYVLLAFVIFFFLADIIMAMLLPITLPVYVTRLHFYPPYDSLVDVDTAMAFCPCLAKNVEYFRNKKWIKFARNTTDVMTSITIQMYPYVGSLHRNSQGTHFACPVVAAQIGTILASKYCIKRHDTPLNMSVRLESPYTSKGGSIYRVIYAHTRDFLYILKVDPPLSDDLRDVAVRTNTEELDTTNYNYAVAHYWDENWDKLEFATDMFTIKKKIGCRQKESYACYEIPYPINATDIVVTFCKPTVLGLKPLRNSTWDHWQHCMKLFVGDCKMSEKAQFCEKEKFFETAPKSTTLSLQWMEYSATFTGN